ncbi:MAG: NADH-quinone oxidoreductase subunit NuoN [Helicobacteraceae bacterium]|nr:NADH-quinone oxidoreductase subunit NuoN [Helicobacteraceae bacterium]
MALSFSSLNILSILPMCLIVGGGILILIVDIILNKFNKTLCIGISSISIALSFLSILDLENTTIGFYSLISIDGLSVLSQMIILIASLFFIFLAISKDKFGEFECSEFYILFLFMIASYQFMVSSNNLILIFLGLESSSLALYALIALAKNEKSLEAGIKYFTLGAFGSGIFAFGLLFVYAGSGSLNISDIINSILLVNMHSDGEYFVLLGFIFLFVAIGFKLSFVPFHTWVPDVYEGSSSPLAFYMSIVTKIAAFVVLIRVCSAFMYVDIPIIRYILFAFVVIGTTIPNIIALLQNDVQRMLAYSSISQAGFVLACIFIDTTQSLVALFLYWVLFLFSNLGAFGMLWLSHNKDKQWDSRYSYPFIKFSGLVRLSPLLAVSFAIFMLSLGGIPPFGLFWGKMYLISSSISAGYNILALILLLNSAIAIYYYMKLIIYMFLKEPIAQDSKIYIQNISYPMVGVIVIALFVSIFGIFFVEGFIDIIYSYLFNF